MSRTITPRQQAQAEARVRRAAFVAQVRDRYGKHAATAIKIHAKTLGCDTIEDLIPTLAEGIEATIYCRPDQPEGRGRWPKHSLRLRADGGIDLPHHPDVILSDARLDGDRLMVALGGFEAAPPACVEAALVLPRRTGAIYANQRSVATATITAGSQGLGHLRVLHTMIAWAQDPHAPWDPALCDKTLKWGITPAMLREYEADGWTTKAALPWLQHRIPLSVANQWRTAGRATSADAALCANGDHLETDDWLESGLTPRQALTWRNCQTKDPSLTPVEAARWHQRGLSPSTYLAVRDHRRRTWHGLPADRLATDTVFAYADAGVPNKTLVSWLLVDCSLDEALAWADLPCGPTLYTTLAQFCQRENIAMPLPVEVEAVIDAVGVQLPVPDIALWIDRQIPLDYIRTRCQAARDANTRPFPTWQAITAHARLRPSRNR